MQRTALLAVPAMRAWNTCKQTAIGALSGLVSTTRKHVFCAWPLRCRPLQPVYALQVMTPTPVNAKHAGSYVIRLERMRFDVQLLILNCQLMASLW
jgi:hypothetical protein